MMMKKSVLAIFLCSTVFFTISNSAVASLNSDESSLTNAIAAKAPNLKPKVLQLALHAYFKAKQMGVRIEKPILTVIDYEMPSTAKRMWVLDLSQQKVLYNVQVAHGKYSGDNYATRFSNSFGSLESSLGLFLTKDTYVGHDGYSLKIAGLERGINDHAEARHIIIHGARYVSPSFAQSQGRIGRSWGCPAVELSLAKPIIDTIKHGSLVFSYYSDSNWIQNSRFL